MKIKTMLKSKKAFTLIECIVGIAVFAIMSGIVMLLIMSSITISEENEKIQSDMNTQLVEIAADEDVHRMAHDVSAADVNLLEFDVDKNMVDTSKDLKVSYDTISYDSYIDADGNVVTIDPLNDLSVLLTAITPNTVRYGTVPEDTATRHNKVITVPTGVKDMTIHCLAEPGVAIYSVNGQSYCKYTLTIQSISDEGAAARTLIAGDKIQITLPQCNEDVVSNAPDARYKYNIVGVDGMATLSGSNFTATMIDNFITISSTDGDFSGLSGSKFEFILVNSVNSNDFEYDYFDVAGRPSSPACSLTKWWFGWGTGNNKLYRASSETPTLLEKYGG